MNRMSADQYRALVGVANQPPMHAANGRPVRQPPPTEKTVQWQIVQALKLIGVEVMQTSQQRASGVTVGLPDLFAYVGGGVWLGIEVKRDGKAKLSPEQIRLRDEGKIVVCWSAQMALDAIRQKSAQVSGGNGR